MIIPPESDRFSNSMLRRMQIIAEYVIAQQKEDYKLDFQEYWDAKWPGTAQAYETLEFFASDRIWSDLYLTRKVKI